MKYIFLLIAILVLSSCSQNKEPKDVAKAEYTNKYGYNVSKQDWEERGKDGTVTHVMQDGSTITSTYVNGILHGNKNHTLPHRRVIIKTEKYVKGVLISTTTNFENGLPKQKKEFHSPVSWTITTWYDSGTPKSKELYTENLLVTGKYLSQNNTTEAYVKDYNGKRIERSPKGILLTKDTIKNGMVTFKKVFYTNGNLKSKSQYQNNLIHGTKRTFTEYGEPLSVEEWNSGKQEGPTTTFKNDLRSEIAYKSGKKHGVERIFNENENLVEEITWSDGQKHGKTNTYIDGKKYTKWFCKGKQLSKAAWQNYKTNHK